jgi:hypothetical protein
VGLLIELLSAICAPLFFLYKNPPQIRPIEPITRIIMPATRPESTFEIASGLPNIVVGCTEGCGVGRLVGLEVGCDVG